MLWNLVWLSRGMYVQRWQLGQKMRKMAQIDFERSVVEESASLVAWEKEPGRILGASNPACTSLPNMGIPVSRI
jgi:hypothetical protein